MAFCINCGSQIPDGAKFCPSCGTPVASIPTPAPAPVPEPIPAPKEVDIDSIKYAANRCDPDIKFTDAGGQDVILENAKSELK